MCQLKHLCCHPDLCCHPNIKELQRYEKNIYDKIFPPPATIIIYDLLIKMNVYVSIQR